MREVREGVGAGAAGDESVSAEALVVKVSEKPLTDDAVLLEAMERAQSNGGDGFCACNACLIYHALSLVRRLKLGMNQ